ncbi:proline-rich receptor-like protein kinase PERK2 isoform X1 [Esox lucius]|nr:proline-rich receptor-like protein kinase PERK2 isoform X1 [Esox lucius]
MPNPPATALKVTTPPPVSSPAPTPALVAQSSAPAPASSPLSTVPVRVNTPTPALLPSPSQATSPVAPGPSNPSGESAVSSSHATTAPTGSQPVPTTTEPPNQPAPPDAPASADNTPASVEPEGLQQEEAAATEKTAEDGATISEQGWAKKRKTPVNLVPRVAVEKPKGPSRRSSRADKEVDEETVADSMQRKRPARPGASAATKETGASPTQAKRRKSK